MLRGTTRDARRCTSKARRWSGGCPLRLMAARGASPGTHPMTARPLRARRGVRRAISRGCSGAPRPAVLRRFGKWSGSETFGSFAAYAEAASQIVDRPFPIGCDHIAKQIVAHFIADVCQLRNRTGCPPRQEDEMIPVARFDG